ncbi:MAG: hypothetical protein M8364_20275 [Methylobacter sp.]|uniref:hypothetical protein n=1 Tax=Methylobacter sp. TaxID=2051955 RepID=UPI00258B0166|nr:hypothetical protein [Methylobacter sp.]MCL7423229.1 hypothetical protein [Methylobacter sp.]
MNQTQELSLVIANQLAEQVSSDGMDKLEEFVQRMPAISIVPPGFVLVDVILPAHQALIARKWADQAHAKINVPLNEQFDTINKD